jgi:hypothetical protein
MACLVTLHTFSLVGCGGWVTLMPGHLASVISLCCVFLCAGISALWKGLFLHMSVTLADLLSPWLLVCVTYAFFYTLHNSTGGLAHDLEDATPICGKDSTLGFAVCK